MKMLYTSSPKCKKKRIEPNSATLATVLRTCASLAVLNTGLEVHLDKDIYVATSLINMHSKSGNLQNAYRVFKNISDKNLASSNAMIMAFATYDQEKYFDEMMSKYGVTPRLQHYTSIVDLLARGGYVDEALDFIRDMPPEPDASLWGALLGTGRIHKNLERAEIAAKHLFKLEPHNSANCMLMMSLYTYEKRYENVENMRITMNAANLKSKAGWSWIQIDETMHVSQWKGNNIQIPDNF